MGEQPAAQFLQQSHGIDCGFPAPLPSTQSQQEVTEQNTKRSNPQGTKYIVTIDSFLPDLVSLFTIFFSFHSKNILKHLLYVFQLSSLKNRIWDKEYRVQIMSLEVDSKKRSEEVERGEGKEEKPVNTQHIEALTMSPRAWADGAVI